VQRNLAYGKSWMLRIGNLLLADPSLNLDRQRFLKKGAEAMKTTPEQARSFWNVVAENVTAESPEWFSVMSKHFETLGTPEVCRALQGMRDPATALDDMDAVGLGALVGTLKQQIQLGTATKAQASASSTGTVRPSSRGSTPVPGARSPCWSVSRNERSCWDCPRAAARACAPSRAEQAQRARI